jgi:predicted amidohydrolase
MKVALIQTDLYWEDISANLSHLEETIWGIKDELDLIVLPEMFNTGFSMKAEKLAEPMNLHTFKWLKQMSQQTNAAITGSYMVKENGSFFNRLVWMQPDGIFYTYDKRHLFTYGGEQHTFKAGNNRLLVDWRGWKFCPLICYDLRFPVWSRNDAQESFDCLLYVANWPQKRIVAWNALLKARAIENVCYCLGVNRVGQDGTGIYHNGDTTSYDFLGHTMAHSTDKEEVLLVALDKQKLAAFRAAFPVLMDGDPYHLL